MEVLKSLLKTDEETEAQRGYVSYPRTHSRLVAKSDWLLQSITPPLTTANPTSSFSQLC